MTIAVRTKCKLCDGYMITRVDAIDYQAAKRYADKYGWHNCKDQSSNKSEDKK